jgi:NTP pyrophosphatase (non-canonical NTP hydrolase)
MSDLTFAQLQERSDAWRAANFSDTNRDPDSQFLGMVEEMGELAHARLKLDQQIRGGALGAAQLLSDERDAVGDLVIYLCGYCSARNLSLQECVEQAWEEVRQRDWKKFPVDGRTK